MTPGRMLSRTVFVTSFVTLAVCSTIGPAEMRIAYRQLVLAYGLTGRGDRRKIVRFGNGQWPDMGRVREFGDPVI